MPCQSIIALNLFGSCWRKGTVNNSVDHYPKQRNLEAYYKGYAAMKCAFRSKYNIVLQKFNHTSESTQEYPLYECKIPTQGCKKDSDCHGPGWCECKGKSCIRLSDVKINGGDIKKSANPFLSDGWGWQGCTLNWHGFSCYCSNESSDWKVIWRQSYDGIRRKMLKN